MIRAIAVSWQHRASLVSACWIGIVLLGMVYVDPMAALVMWCGRLEVGLTWLLVFRTCPGNYSDVKLWLYWVGGAAVLLSLFFLLEGPPVPLGHRIILWWGVFAPTWLLVVVVDGEAVRERKRLHLQEVP